MRFLFLLMVCFNSLYAASSCELLVNQLTTVKANLGSMTIASDGANFIWLSSTTGDKTSIFNYDDLFEFHNSVGSWYFRLNGKAFNHNGAGQTFLYEGAWAFNMVPPNGTYTITSHYSPRKPIFGRTIDTIGDSITWWTYGRFLRCYMRDQGLMYDFKGSHTDIFGFQHDGDGGNTTQNVLDRMESIPSSDAYFVLIGTNDRINPEETFDNIVTISELLKQKNPCARIYISTLLPRNDSYNTRNQEINNYLRDYSQWCSGCTLIDLGAYFYGLSNWASYLMADGLHPNDAGYQKIALYLAPRLL